MKVNNKPTTPIQQKALELLRYAKCELKKIPANVGAIEPKFSEARRNFYLSCPRIIRAIEEANTDPQLFAATKLSYELLADLTDYADVCGWTAEDRLIVEEIFGDDIK